MSDTQFLLKHSYVPNFLPPEDNQAILDSLIEDLAAFEDATVFTRGQGSGVLDHDTRVAKTTSLRPEMRTLFNKAIKAALPQITEAVGLAMRDDFRFEISAALHQDGGFFTRHIDTRTIAEGETARYISIVYYLCQTPQRFSGGQFRLHPLVGDSYKDFEASNNTLMAFPSMAPHEVRPISVPSRRAEDGRFSINCWVRIPRTAA